MKKTIICVCFLCLALTAAGCGSKVPALADLVKGGSREFSAEEPGLKDAAMKQLTKAWGTPLRTVGDESSGSAVWQSGDRFVEIWFTDGRLSDGCVSATLNATVTEISEGTVAIICPDEEQWERRSTDKIFLSMQWLSEEQAAVFGIGTELRIEYNGRLMETYPCQIDRPYIIEITGP